MAAYPAYLQLISSDEEWIDDVTIDRAVGGGVKSRSFFTAKKRAFTVRHLLNATDRATLVTFYDTNRLLTVSFTWAKTGVSYTCLFAGPIKWNESKYPYTEADVRLVEQ